MPKPHRLHKSIACLSVALGLGLTASLSVSATPPPAKKPATPKLILISWDGAGDVVIDRLLEERRLPNLEKLRANGTGASHLYGTLPSKTASSHASIYTGCGPQAHGVVDNSILHYEQPGLHTVLERRRGFAATALTAEPLFLTTARAGLRTAVLGATQYIPHQALSLPKGDLPQIAEGDYLSFSGFESQLYRSRVLDTEALGPPIDASEAGWQAVPTHNGPVREVDLGIPELFALIYDDPADPVDGFDRLLLRQGRKSQSTLDVVLEAREATSEAAGWSPLMRAVKVDDDGKESSGRTMFRLFELAPDGSKLTLYRSRATSLLGQHTAAQRQAFLAVDSGSHDVPFPTYALEAFGRALPSSGDGTAERRLLEAVAADIDLRIAGTQAIWKSFEPEALFLYSPMSDQAGHMWTSAINPQSSRYDARVAAQLWPFYAAVFENLDRWLGSLLELAGDEAVVALVSDHGMAPVTNLVNIQKALENAGLLAFDASGAVDLGHTQILNAESDFFLRVNDVRWKGGIVPRSERQAVIDRAADALLAVRDEATGHHPIQRIFTADQLEDFAAAGPRRGDLYYDFAAGYYPTRRDSRRNPGAVIYPVPFRIGQGSHGFWPGRRDMHAIFYLSGPGVAAGVQAPAARQIDVAPTLSRVLGIPAPREACGRILAEALAH